MAEKNPCDAMWDRRFRLSLPYRRRSRLNILLSRARQQAVFPLIHNILLSRARQQAVFQRILQLPPKSYAFLTVSGRDFRTGFLFCQ